MGNASLCSMPVFPQQNSCIYDEDFNHNAWFHVTLMLGVLVLAVAVLGFGGGAGKGEARQKEGDEEGRGDKEGDDEKQKDDAPKKSTRAFTKEELDGGAEMTGVGIDMVDEGGREDGAQSP